MKDFRIKMNNSSVFFIIFTALLGVLLIDGTVLGKPPKQAGTPLGPERAQALTAAENTKLDERGTAQEPLAINPLVVKTYVQKSEKEAADEQEQMREKAEADWWVIFVGWATIIILALQAVAFFIQAKRLKETIGAMRKIADDQRTDVGDAITIAKENAIATRRAADIAEQSMISDRRPWVKINSVVQRGKLADGADDKDGGYNLDVSVKNVGSSPAICIFANAEMVGDQFPSEPDLKNIVERLRRKIPSKGITLVPGDSVIVNAYCVPDQSKCVREASDLGLMVCCVYYSFTFNAAKNEGHFESVYRIGKESLEARNLKINAEQRYAHAE